MLTGRGLVRLCLVSGLWAFGFGVGMQVISHWLHHRHAASDALIGYVQASYYLGIALASLAAPWLTRRWGTRCIVVGLLGAGLSLVCYPWVESEVGWFGLRMLNGIASALTLVPLETQLSRDCPKDIRVRHFACFGISVTLGGALGIGFGLDCVDAAGFMASFLGSAAMDSAFYVGGAAPILGSLLMGPWAVATSAASEPAPPATRLSWRKNFLSYGTAWGQGFIEGGMIAFLSLYLVAAGLTGQEAGLLMGVTLVGVILFQGPAAWLAGRWGNTPTLLACYGVVWAGLLLAPWMESPWTLGTCLFLLGACSGAMYPLGLALLGDGLPESSLPRAYAVYMALECVGSQMGAAAMGQARDWWGGGAMFPVALAAISIVLVAWRLLPRGLDKQPLRVEIHEPTTSRTAA